MHLLSVLGKIVFVIIIFNKTFDVTRKHFRYLDLPLKRLSCFKIHDVVTQKI